MSYLLKRLKIVEAERDALQDLQARTLGNVRFFEGLADERFKALHDLLLVLDAHEVETLDCDRRGNKYCDCLEKVLKPAKALTCSHAQ